jgi:hypothetical protein
MATNAVLDFIAMTGDGSSSAGDGGRVVKFPRGDAVARPLPGTPPVADLGEFERGSEADDYRHRMLVNAAAFVFVAALIGAGLWLADTMASLRRNQDCVLAGHHNCAPVDIVRER